MKWNSAALRQIVYDIQRNILNSADDSLAAIITDSNFKIKRDSGIHLHINKALYGTIRRIKSIRKHNKEHEIPLPAKFASNVHPNTGVQNLQQQTRQQFWSEIL